MAALYQKYLADEPLFLLYSIRDGMENSQEAVEMKNEDSEEQKWVYCPVCGNKTRLRLQQDTILLHFPLFCPKCRAESLIDAKNFRIRQVGG